jgi:hypothetical protein
MYYHEFFWKSFKVNLQELDEWCKENVTLFYIKIEATDGSGKLAFTSIPPKDKLDVFDNLWKNIRSSDDMARSYRSKEEILNERKNLRETALNELAQKVGLSKDVIRKIIE